MENKAVCYYCGTIYDAERGKCPLCGSSVHADETEAQRASVPHRRLTEEELRQRRRAARGKNTVSKTDGKSPKGLLTAAMVFLALSVLVVFYFIGDMIGWWPGLEDLVQRDNQLSTVTVDKSCSLLKLDAQTLEIDAPGQTKQLKITLNASCDETLYCNSGDEKIATISEKAQTSLGAEEKSAVFTVTAVGQGETEITVKCGQKTESCKVVCGDPSAAVATQPSTVDANYEPELNCGEDLSLYRKGEAVLLQVENLPDGMSVKWSSSDATVAKVDEAGIVTGIGGGTATITAEVAGRKTEVLVRCAFDDDDIGAHLQYEDVTIAVGESFYLYLYDADGEHITDITYTVEDPDICEVKNSIVTGLKHGTTDVVITYNDKEYTCIVRVH